MLFWADNSQHKRKLLDHWLRDTTINQAIVFASTQVECDGLANDLQQDGFSAVALHGALSQGLRNRRLMALRSGRVQVLVATDVAARGIDVPSITHVFNYGLPMKAEDYTHRIGRTGRAGREGVAVTFAEFRDRRRIFDIEGYSRQQFKAEVIPGLEPAQRAPSGNEGRGGRRGGGFEGRGGDRRGSAGGGRGGFGGDRGFGGGDRERSFGDRGGDRGFGPAVIRKAMAARPASAASVAASVKAASARVSAKAALARASVKAATARLRVKAALAVAAKAVASAATVALRAAATVVRVLPRWRPPRWRLPWCIR